MTPQNNRGPGWGTQPPYRSDNPPGAPKLSEAGSILAKSRLGKEKPKFFCQKCDEREATKQMPGCNHVLCQDCLVAQGGECPLC